MNIPNMIHGAGREPWHGFGRQVAPGTDPVEAFIGSPIDFEVETAPGLYVSPITGELTPSGGRVVYRTDTGAPLGRVGSRWAPVQPAEVLDYAARVAGAAGTEVVGMGAFAGGARVWVQLALGPARRIRAGEGQSMEPTALIGTSMDGSAATFGGLVSTIIVCGNTWRLARAESGIRVVHSAGQHSRLAAAVEELRRLDEIAEAEAGRFRAMAEVEATPEAVEAVLDVIQPVPEGRPGKAVAIRDRIIAATASIAMGAGRGSLWDLAMGVTQWATHEAGAKSPAARLESVWAGRNAKRVGEALALIGAFAGV